MESETHRWYSDRIGRDIHIRVYGHFGQPILVFPTSGGDETRVRGPGHVRSPCPPHAGRAGEVLLRELGQQRLLVQQEDSSRRTGVKFQVAYDSAIAERSASLHRAPLQSAKGIAITTTPAPLSAHTTRRTPCSSIPPGCADVSLSPASTTCACFVDGHFDENFYFNNPVDYMANLTDWNILQYRTPVRHPPRPRDRPLRRQRSRRGACPRFSPRSGIPHHLDDWREQGGHDWPYWKHQMDVYISRLF